MKHDFLHTTDKRHGMTLVELLIVAGLLVLMLAIAVPVLSPMAEGRQAREAVRGIQAALDTARARAMRLGRPCGVAFPPFEGGNGTTYPVCIQLEQLTAPPLIHTTCNVSTAGPSNFGWTPYDFKKGDRVQINNTGPWLQYSGASWSKAAGNGESFELYNRNNVPCTISYAPVSESGNAFAKVLGLDPTYVIPRGIVVDLQYSGIGESGTLGATCGDANNPPSIVFYPDGSAKLSAPGAAAAVVQNGTPDRIYLLVGRWDVGLGLAENGQEATTNYSLPTSFWVVVNTSNGTVTTAMNKTNSAGGGSVTTAREWAKDPTRSMGGR